MTAQELDEIKDKAEELSASMEETKDYCVIIHQEVDRFSSTLSEYEVRRAYDRSRVLVGVLLDRLFEETKESKNLVNRLYNH